MQPYHVTGWIIVCFLQVWQFYIFFFCAFITMYPSSSRILSFRMMKGSNRGLAWIIFTYQKHYSFNFVMGCCDVRPYILTSSLLYFPRDFPNPHSYLRSGTLKSLRICSACLCSFSSMRRRIVSCRERSRYGCLRSSSKRRWYFIKRICSSVCCKSEGIKG